MHITPIIRCGVSEKRLRPVSRIGVSKHVLELWHSHPDISEPIEAAWLGHRTNADFVLHDNATLGKVQREFNCRGAVAARWNHLDAPRDARVEPPSNAIGSSDSIA